MTRIQVLIVSMLLGISSYAGSIILSAYVLPYTLTDNTPLVLSTTDFETWSDGFGLYLDEDCFTSAYVVGTNGIAVLRGATLPIEKWSHLSLKINHGEASFFIDGVLQDHVAVEYVDEPNADLIIADDGYMVFDGEVRLDEVRFDSLSNSKDEGNQRSESNKTDAIEEMQCEEKEKQVVKAEGKQLFSQISDKEALLQSLISVKEASMKKEVKVSSKPLFVLHRRLE